MQKANSLRAHNVTNTSELLFRKAWSFKIKDQLYKDQIIKKKKQETFFSL